MDETKPGRHARRVMEAYARMFEGQPELDVLRALGYFDRPAEPAVLRLVLPKMPGLRYQAALNRLCNLRLILTREWTKPLDCHPLVREFFAIVMRETSPDAFRASHSRLYEHYCNRALTLPDTLNEMEPLLYAVYHGCHAGRYVEAVQNVYQHRILRGAEFHLIKKLGAFGTNLSILANFFEIPWIVAVSMLSAADQAWVVNNTSFTLRALGRLSDALEPTRRSVEAAVEMEHWNNAAAGLANLSELHLTLGNVMEAIDAARRGIEIADRSGDAFRRMANCTTLAGALHQSGELAESKRLFEKAERILADRQSRSRVLSSLGGYRYCDLLLSQGKNAEVLDRATQGLGWAQAGNWLLDNGLNHLSLGRAYPPGSPESAANLDQAVDYLRRAGHLDYLPLALLARGTPHDLEEAYTIATRSGMRLHLTKYHLAQARRLEPALAREHLESAAALIAETGYHRRDAELAAITALLFEPGSRESPKP